MSYFIGDGIFMGLLGTLLTYVSYRFGKRPQMQFFEVSQGLEWFAIFIFAALLMKYTGLGAGTPWAQTGMLIVLFNALISALIVVIVAPFLQRAFPRKDNPVA